MSAIFTDIGRLLALATIFTVAACGGRAASDVTGEAKVLLEQIEARAAIVSQREESVVRREARISAAEAALRKAEDPDAETTPRVQLPVAVDSQLNTPLFPPLNARPGQCYGLGMLPARLSNRPETIDVKPAYQQHRYIQPIFTNATERVLVDGYVEGAPLGSQTITVTLKPAWTEYLIEPATFQSQKIEVVTRSNYQRWQPCSDNGAGWQPEQSYCGSSVEAQTQSVKIQTLISNSTVTEIEHPAKTTHIKVIHRNKAFSGKPRWREFPVQRIERDSQLQTTEVPAETQTFTREVQTTEARLDWFAVLCDSERKDDALIESLQRALIERGYLQGPADGKLGALTLKAIRKFEQDEQLANTQPHVSWKVVERLGVRR